MTKKTKKILLLICSCLLFNTMAEATNRVWNPEAYSEKAVYQKKEVGELVTHFSLRGDETVLDIGSADGKSTAFIATQVPQGSVLGVDKAPEMVAFAKKTFAEIKNLTFQLSDIRTLLFKNTFDIVTSFRTMHLIEDQETVWQVIYRVLKPKGRVLMQFPIASGFDSLLDEIPKEEQWWPYFQNFSSGWHFFQSTDYERYVRSSGLKPTRIEVTTLDEVYASPEVFAESIKTWLPHMAVLSQAQQTIFLKELISRYTKEISPLDSEGRVHYKVQRMEIEAVKT